MRNNNPPGARGRYVIIGLLGGVGAGKSTVAGMFRRLGARVVDADRVAHQVLASSEMRRKVAGMWGDAALNRSGRPDRRKIAGIVFGSKRELARLEACLHPLVIRTMLRAGRRAKGVVVWDAPLLVEKGFHKDCDVLMYIDADRSRRLLRIRPSRRWKNGDLQRREQYQMGLNKKRRLAEYIIDNNHSRASTFKQVRSIYNEIINTFTPPLSSQGGGVHREHTQGNSPCC